MDFYAFFMISAMEWEAWEAQNLCKCIEFDDLFMISSVEREAWELQNY